MFTTNSFYDMYQASNEEWFKSLGRLYNKDYIKQQDSWQKDFWSNNSKMFNMFQSFFQNSADKNQDLRMEFMKLVQEGSNSDSIKNSLKHSRELAGNMLNYCYDMTEQACKANWDNFNSFYNQVQESFNMNGEGSTKQKKNTQK